MVTKVIGFEGIDSIALLPGYSYKYTLNGVDLPLATTAPFTVQGAFNEGDNTVTVQLLDKDGVAQSDVISATVTVPVATVLAIKPTGIVVTDVPVV